MVERRSRGRPKAWDDKSEQNTVKSLDRAMGVLEHLSTRPGASLSELAGDLDQSTATVYRILTTLQARDLVELDPETQLWHVGPRAFLIGARYLRRTSVVDRARPVLRRLMEETGETANLAIPREGNVLFIMQVECHEMIRAFFPPGTLSPMHASGIGKALLAQYPPDRLTRHLKRHERARFTARTLVAGDALADDLQHTRARGYAIDDEERNDGMRCIAAAVTGWQGDVVAGISVSGPVSRVTQDRTAALGTMVREAAAELSAALGAADQV